MSIYAKAVVYGNPGTVAYTGLAAADNKAKGLSLADSIRVNDARDGLGRIFASSIERDSHTITVDLIPFDADGTTLANAQSVIALPGPGALVTLAALGNSLLNGDWNYIGGGNIELSSEATDPVIIRGLQLRRVSTDGSTVAVQSAVF